MEEIFVSSLHEHINDNNLAFLMTNCANCWLGIALDYIGGVILFLSIVTTVLAALNGTISSSYVGLAVSYTLLVPIYLNWVVRQLAHMEMHMSAVERIAAYTILEDENATAKTDDRRGMSVKVRDLPKSWPSCGKILFDSVTIRYDTNSPIVLKSVSLEIRSGEKASEPMAYRCSFFLNFHKSHFPQVCVCGRTGSGKSTLLMSLLKMVSVDEGRILIDDINVVNIENDTLRQNLSLVPQDNILFSGSIRYFSSFYTDHLPVFFSKEKFGSKNRVQ